MSMLGVGIAVIALTVAGCCTADRPCVRDVPAADVLQIARAMRDSGYAPIKLYTHHPSDPPRIYRVRTTDGAECELRFVRGKWYIYDLVVVYG